MLTSTFSFVFSILMVAVVINAIRQMSRAGASRNWFTTNGKVVYSSTHQEPDGPYFIPVVKYRYRVEEQEYESSRIRFTWSGESTHPWTASEVVNKYSVSKTIRVYYNPKNPSVSVLVPGVAPKDYVSAVVGFLIWAWIVFSPLIVEKPTNLQLPKNSFENGAWSDDP